ncbi:MAG: winged helix-turn-helix transcriptional regulator [Theionarchaea archaeon]|nr:winged helix-turn-helix transcriptional regulator [Theionarchaea archaeon]
MRKKLSDHELLELYQQGLTNKEIADKMGMAQSSVHYRLENHGLKNNCHQREHVDLNQVRILNGLGLTNIGIALIMKTNVTMISQCIKDLGLEGNYHEVNRLLSWK